MLLCNPQAHFTKFQYIFFFDQKSEAIQVLENVLAHAENLGHNIKEILSDNGGEFHHTNISRILLKNGRLTTLCIHLQNRGIEHENRTLVEMPRPLKNSNPEMNFPSSL